MNILHHKSWHVRTKRNIERVRRDEQKAQQEEDEREGRILLAEQERRTQLLRDKAQTSGQTVTTHVVEGSVPSKHINIFDDFEDKVRTTNIEHEKEAKEEKEKWEKSIGLLNYLHNKDEDLGNNWYLQSHEVRMKLTDDKKSDDCTKNLKDVKVKKFNDPLEDMKRYLDVMKSKSDDKQKTDKNDSKRKSIEFVKSKDSAESKKSKHKKKKRRRYSSDSSQDSRKTSSKSVSKSLEQLRAERLRREKAERERTRALLSSRSQTKSDSVILDDRQRTYNSQFNPQIARQNFDR